ncbi:MAG: hypothetical protein QOH69_1144 [Actinomycetota bacterium]|nr:hypothetical protein [Actinomycetota bacterium]
MPCPAPGTLEGRSVAVMANDEHDQPIGTSTRVRDQPSLTTSSGKSWLILGGLLSLIAVAVLVPLLSQKPAGVALFAVCAIVALYAAMVVVRFNARPGRRMLGWLATFMIAIAVIGVVCVGIIAGSSGNVVLM